MRLGPLWRLRQPAAAEAEATEAVAQPPAIAPDRTAFAESSAMPLQMPSADVADIDRMTWDELGSAVADCRRCGLCAARKQAVLGVGDRQADWLFVGEGPGAEEDERGEPFVGQAGKLLDNMLAAIGLRRGEDVYIANAVKCRPPANRTPEAEEIAACRPYLQRQIALLRPKLIVALGRPAAQALLQSEVKIAAARGRLHDLDGLPVIVTYHPAYLLRNLPDKAKAWEDLCLMRRTMRELKANG
jgi:DNA polymerase